MGYPGGTSGKNLPANEGDIRYTLGWEDPLEEDGNPLQYSCLKNPMDRGVWQATVRSITRVGHDLATKPPPPQSAIFSVSWLSEKVTLLASTPCLSDSLACCASRANLD